MQTNVETKKVVEAQTADSAVSAEETTPKYPEYDIQRMTSVKSMHEREIIKMHATSKTTYDKYYCPIGVMPDGAPQPIRRTKQVKLPVSIDKKTFTTTTDLWEYLVASGGYSRAPKQAKRTKLFGK